MLSGERGVVGAYDDGAQPVLQEAARGSKAHFLRAHRDKTTAAAPEYRRARDNYVVSNSLTVCDVAADKKSRLR